MTPSADPTLPPPVPVRTMGFSAFRLLGPPAGSGAQESSTSPSGPSSPSSLSSRRAGQSVMAETLRLQGAEPPRSWWQRLIGASPLGPDSRSWFRGALGEIAVGQILRRLGPEWTVLHAVPVGAGASDIDHVLIGPAGVFTLNTKNHSGKTIWVGEHAIRVDGHQQHYLTHSRHEAARAAKRLGAAVGEQVHVTPVLVLVKPKELTVRQSLAGVEVLTNQKLLRWLRRRRPVLTADQVARIVAAAVLPGTWHDAPAPHEDPESLVARFSALQTSVRSAGQRRRLWVLAMLGGSGAAVALQAAQYLDRAVGGNLF